MSDRVIYNIGVKLDSKEEYDRLMKGYSDKGFFSGIDFEGLFEGYPPEYPMVLYYMVDRHPIGFEFQSQLRKLIDAGFTIVLKLNEEES